jgi:8-oxo-dGTP pyrophosphatase MutT (NUDIX family)
MFTPDRLQQVLSGPLPGQTGQEKMAPAPVRRHPDRWELPVDCREAAVLLLLYRHQSTAASPDWYLALIKRPDYAGVHSGQIALPGGQREASEALMETALRETREEIGVAVPEENVVGQLSPLYTPPSNFCIYPFVAVYSHQPDFQPDSREVSTVVEVPVRMFFDPSYRKEEIWRFEKYGDRRVPFFDILGHKVWGATAMILSEFTALVSGVNHG